PAQPPGSQQITTADGSAWVHCHDYITCSVPRSNRLQSQRPGPLRFLGPQRATAGAHSGGSSLTRLLSDAQFRHEASHSWKRKSMRREVAAAQGKRKRPSGQMNRRQINSNSSKMSMSVLTNSGGRIAVCGEDTLSTNAP